MTTSPDSRQFNHFSWTKAAKASLEDGATLVWPFGAFEQHGPHLPLLTDTLFAEKILIEVLYRLPSSCPIWRLPSQAIGFSPEHVSFPGTISLSADVMLQMVSEIGEQVADMGFKRLVFFNAHGGQIGLLQTIARQLRVKCPTMAVLPCFLWSGVNSLKDLIPDKEVEEGLHAALAETSLMLHLNPDLVGLERPIDGVEDESLNSSKSFNSAPKGWSLEGAAPCAWLTQDLSKSGVIGNSSSSSSGLGKQIHQALVDHWANLFLSLMKSNWPPVQ
tara:strand:- start:2088 stop:2912 length:825 start_codon:yes stop_codon:yes gene_type:complete